MTPLILTAGLGTRLAPLTTLRAKAVVPLAGRTLVERLLAWLASQGVTGAVLNLHHRPETITERLGDGAHLGVRVRYSWEQPVVLGSAGGPRHALPLIDSDPFPIVNGDTLSAVDLAAMTAAFDAGTDVLMAVVPNPAPRHYSGLRLDDQGRVTGLAPRGDAAAGSWHFIGVQLVRKSVFAPLADGVPAESIGGLYRGMIASGAGRVRGFPVDTAFLDVGTPRDYLDAAVALAGGDAASLVEPGAAVESTARLHETIVWREASIGAHAHLTRCIVVRGRVPEGITATEQIFLDGTWRPLRPAPPASGGH